jgi:hypothetical protein
LPQSFEIMFVVATKKRAVLPTKANKGLKALPSESQSQSLLSPLRLTQAGNQGPVLKPFQAIAESQTQATTLLMDTYVDIQDSSRPKESLEELQPTNLEVALASKDNGKDPLHALNSCCVKGCKRINAEHELRLCSSNMFGTCNKFIHSACYGMFLRSQNLPGLISADGSITFVACSKRCYNKIHNAMVNNNIPTEYEAAHIPWEKDGQEGPEDINNSMAILLDWLMENGGSNYNMYRGKNLSGLTKNDYAEQIARKINSFGVRSKRTPNQVLSKIFHLEKTFRVAHDWKGMM